MNHLLRSMSIRHDRVKHVRSNLLNEAPRQVCFFTNYYNKRARRRSSTTRFDINFNHKLKRASVLQFPVPPWSKPWGVYSSGVGVGKGVCWNTYSGGGPRPPAYLSSDMRPSGRIYIDRPGDLGTDTGTGHVSLQVRQDTDRQVPDGGLTP